MAEDVRSAVARVERRRTRERRYRVDRVIRISLRSIRASLADRGGEAVAAPDRT